AHACMISSESVAASATTPSVHLPASQALDAKGVCSQPSKACLLAFWLARMQVRAASTPHPPLPGGIVLVRSLQLCSCAIVWPLRLGERGTAMATALGRERGGGWRATSNVQLKEPDLAMQRGDSGQDGGDADIA
ncbi:hypothetical protein FB639_001901, partial [Coemansia asiatica]